MRRLGLTEVTAHGAGDGGSAKADAVDWSHLDPGFDPHSGSPFEHALKQGTGGAPRRGPSSGFQAARAGGLAEYRRIVPHRFAVLDEQYAREEHAAQLAGRKG